MNNRYTLPVAVAAAIHAFVFGFDPSTPKPNPTPKPPSEPPVEAIKIVPLVDPVEKTETAAKGSSESPPKLDEPTPILGDKPIIAISVPPRDSRPTLPSIEAQPPGVLTGSLIGAGTIGVFTVTGLDKTPRAQVQMAPEYPFSAKKEGLDGEVVVEFLVDETGRVSNPVIVRSSHSVFDEPSLRAVLKWRFEPGRRDGKVVRFRMAVPVVFRLNND